MAPVQAGIGSGVEAAPAGAEVQVEIGLDANRPEKSRLTDVPTGAVACVPADPLPDLVQRQAQTGLRRGELAGSRTQVNLDRRRVHIC